MTDTRSPNSAQWLPRASLIISLGLVACLAVVYWATDSLLALAQAADSFLDMFTGAVLAWTVAVGAKPKDEDHPFGHSRAEPIGALVAAVIAGVLAVEVLRSSIFALLDDHHPALPWWLAVVFGGKAVLKAGIALLSRRGFRMYGSPALRALMVDARNDVAVCTLSICGFAAARYGWRGLDAVLAIPAALWIGWSGFSLARDNIRLLMGEAPPPERQAELLELARRVPGVEDAHDMRAHFVGTEVHLHVHIIVDRSLSILEAHDIGEAVRERLEREPDVGHTSVHIDIE